MRIFETIKKLIELKRRFPAYPLGMAPLWFWEKELFGKIRQTGYPSHSPSDQFTRWEAERYFKNEPL